MGHVRHVRNPVKLSQKVAQNIIRPLSAGERATFDVE
jgi:hypothetical protein